MLQSMYVEATVETAAEEIPRHNWRSGSSWRRSFVCSRGTGQPGQWQTDRRGDGWGRSAVVLSWA